jgi:hypothetical protein
MKRFGLFVLLLLVFTGGLVFAEGSWWNSYAPGVRDNNLFVNAGVGFGPTGGYRMGIPPVTLSVDYKLPIPLPITVGGFGTFSTWRYSYWNTHVTYTNIGIGGRGMYHFNLLSNLDLYTGLNIGYVIQTSNVGRYSGANFLLWGFNTGARYFFTRNLGAYLELGYSGLNYFNTGVTVQLF